MTKIGNLKNKRILDIGCGLGGFHNYLLNEGIPTSYTGIDITPELIHTASQSMRPGATFIEASFLDYDEFLPLSFDYVFMCGLFACYPRAGMVLINAFLSKAWQLASRGLVFNSLSTFTNQRNLSEFHADPGETLKMASQYTPWLTLRHNYHPRDFTVYMHREQLSSPWC